MSLKVAWVGGWAIPSDYLKEIVEKRFPDFSHDVYVPGPGVVQALNECNYQAVVAYSLGSLVLLHEIEKLKANGRVILLAPIFGFKKESGLGSRVAATQLKVMKRWLKRDPEKAIDDFYNKAGLSLKTGGELPYSIETLDWGLEALLDVEVPAPLEPRVQCILGEKDALLNVVDYQKMGIHLKSVTDGTHDFQTLLAHITWP